MAFFWLLTRVVKRNIRQNPWFGYEFGEVNDAPRFLSDPDQSCTAPSPHGLEIRQWE